MIADATDYQTAQLESRSLEQRLDRLHEELAVFEGTAELRSPESK